MIYKEQRLNPFRVHISFHKVIERLEEIATSDVDYRAQYANGLLKAVSEVPELRTGIDDIALLEKHSALIRNLLSDLFPTALAENEIKAVAVPFMNVTFNYTQRFQEILKNAGPDFDMEIRDFDDHQFYVLSCCMLLHAYYGYNFEFSKPMFYDIPDSQGFLRHYRILYNGDFLEILPTEQAREITPEDVDLLIDNYDDIELWKRLIPPNSWTLKGFGIMNLYDATTESAVSNLKTSLISKQDKTNHDLQLVFEDIFKSIFRMPDLKVGFTSFDKETMSLTASPFEGVNSFMLVNEIRSDSSDFMCENCFSHMMEQEQYFAISDLERYHKTNPSSLLAKHLLEQGFQSVILAPVMDGENVRGIIELVSPRKKALNSINCHQLEVVLPYISESINRFYADVINQIGALIQREYTTIHPSVYWKFRDEAYLHLNDADGSGLHEIVFEDVYPLYGQIDIKGSSEMRNRTTGEDIAVQVDLLLEILRKVFREKQLPVYEARIFELEQFRLNLDQEIKADTEQLVHKFLQQQIHPVLRKLDSPNPEIKELIASYMSRLDENTESIYEARKRYDTTVSVINKQMSALLDKKQVIAQEYYPHYYERFKTDGVEHNMYIGKSINGHAEFDKTYLYNLRLWQLQVMCEMETHYSQLRLTLPYQMDVSSLILVFNQPITVRFRMDEKRFDVDGSYNARYEIVKKRIDKAYVKGQNERITQPDRITIVYTQQTEEREYRRYIHFLQFKGLLAPEIEMLDVEDLQGISGLKAIRVRVLNENPDKTLYSYEELLKELEK